MLTVRGTSNFSPTAFMTLSVDGADAGSDPNIDPILLEVPMVFNPATGFYEFFFATPVELKGRRVLISTDEGGSYRDSIK